MKKVLACAVALALVLCMVPMAFASDPAFIVSPVLTEEGTDKIITVTVSISPATGLQEFNFALQFDNTVLEFVSDELCGAQYGPVFVSNIGGLAVKGLVPEGNAYSFAWVTETALDLAANTEIVIVKFKVIDTTAAQANIKLVPQDEIKTSAGNFAFTARDNFVTIIAAPSTTAPAPSDTAAAPSETNGPTTAPTDFATLLDDIIRSVGLDPDNFDLTGILALIPNGDLDAIREAVEDVFTGTPAEEIFNKIRDLIGGGAGTTAGGATPAGSSTTAAKVPATTAKAATKLDKTGDVGIALAATVCLAAAAAFVLTKKKEDKE